MMAAGPVARHDTTDQLPRQSGLRRSGPHRRFDRALAGGGRGAGDPDRRGHGGDQHGQRQPRDVQVPDVRGQASADAIAALQNKGFKIRTQQKPDNTVAPDHVINTDPAGNSSAGAGDEVTINVSTGPEQREVPDCSNGLSYAECVKKLQATGFGKFKQADAPSTPEQKDKVLSTIPPANQTSAITNEITIVVGSGPQTADVPAVSGQTVDVAQQILTASGFQKTVAVPTDSTQTSGQVLGTNPPPPECSAGHGDPDPGVEGQPVRDARPQGSVLDRRRTEPARPGLDRDADQTAQRRQQRVRSNGVVTQSPPAGSAVNFRRPDHDQLRVVAGSAVAYRTVSATSCSRRCTSASSGAVPQ